MVIIDNEYMQRIAAAKSDLGFPNLPTSIALFYPHVDRLATIITTINMRSEEFWDALRKEVYAIGALSYNIHNCYSHEDGSSFMEEDNDDDNDDDDDDEYEDDHYEDCDCEKCKYGS